MSIARHVLRSAAGALCAAALAACGGHGLVPSQTEQNELQSNTISSSNQPFRATLYRRGFGRFLRGIDLSDQQRAQLRLLLQRFRQAHPPGSPFDRQGLETLHQQMLGVLTPQQQTQLQQNLTQWRSTMHPILLTDAQRAQIRSLREQFRQTHPWGSTFDPQARRRLRDQIWNVLTPEQQTQLRQRFRQRHALIPEQPSSSATP